MPRFYCDLPLTPGHHVALPDAVARHAIGVLRLRAGEEVALFNGDGAEYVGVLENAGGKGASVRLLERRQLDRESPLRVVLAQGISSGERMDFTLQKAVEMGVAAIEPLLMRRTVVRLSDEKALHRRKHWQGVVVSACEQCGRNRIPAVAEIQEFVAWMRIRSPVLRPPATHALPSSFGAGRRCLQNPPRAPDRKGDIEQLALNDIPKGYLRLLLDPQGDVRLSDLPPPVVPVLLLAGPEGGIDPAERRLALASGFHGLRLGSRILRTETAPLAALAAMQAVWGDFR
jgi:16S rRNA (uracil1498-N3)-methyltransferase